MFDTELLREPQPTAGATSMDHISIKTSSFRFVLSRADSMVLDQALGFPHHMFSLLSLAPFQTRPSFLWERSVQCRKWSGERPLCITAATLDRSAAEEATVS